MPGCYLPTENLLHYLAPIRRCTGLRNLGEARRIHEQIAGDGFANHTLLGNSLVQMFGSCGSLSNARLAFDEIASRNAFSWNILIAAHCQNGSLEIATGIFDRMPQRDVVSYNTISVACARAGDVQEIKQLFDSSPERDDVSWNGLVTAFAEKGHLEQAKCVLERSPQFHLVSCTGILAGFLRFGDLRQAQSLFDSMPERDVVACTTMLNAYAHCGELGKAREVFAGMKNRDSASWTSILLACANNGEIEAAREVFDKFPVPDPVSYNAMITSYTQHDQMREAEMLFDSMPEPNEVSWTCMLSAYARLGDIQKAREMFNKMPMKDTIAWNAMISAHTQRGAPGEALKLFKIMTLVEGERPTSESFLVAINACSEVPAPLDGALIHLEVLVDPGASSSSEVENALVSMYGRFGNVDSARRTFQVMKSRDAVSWSAMIAGYAQSGHSREALALFQEMVLEGVEPDKVTLVNFLAACSHSGLLHEGLFIFATMAGFPGIQPDASHYVCLIDLLARAGRVEIAEELARRMPSKSSLAWMSLAGACRFQQYVRVGDNKSELALEHEPERLAAGFALMNQMNHQ